MFKKTSDNTQGRERRKALDTTTNSGGVDETAFAHDPKSRAELRRSLIVKKQALEAKNRLLNRNIALAKRRFTYREPGAVSYETVRRWELEKSNISSEITRIDSLITKIKFELIVSAEAEQKTFAETFKDMARELLADDVFQRILIATIHRIGEQDK